MSEEKDFKEEENAKAEQEVTKEDAETPNPPEVQEQTVPAASPPVAQAPAAPVAAPSEVTPPTEQPPSQPTETQPSEQQQAAPEAPSTSGNEVTITAQKTPVDRFNEKMAHYQQFADDLAFKKVEPKTYADLYADKGILGKIGTIFGLLASGAGSGLTHQPNALLEMMNKEIERDFEAQKTNQTNKHNWYTANLEWQKAQPEIKLKKAMASKAESEAALAKWTNAQQGIEEINADADGKNMATIHMLDEMQQKINGFPPGSPQREELQQLKDQVVAPYLFQKGKERAAEAVAKTDVIEATNPLPKQKSNHPPATGVKTGEHYDVHDQNKYSELVAKGALLGKDVWKKNPKTGKFEPVAIGPQTKAAMDKELADLTVSRANLADTDAAFNVLANMKNAGDVPLSKFASGGVQLVAGLLGTNFLGKLGGAAAGILSGIPGKAIGESAQNYFGRVRGYLKHSLAMRLGGNASETDKESQVEALLPSWADSREGLPAVHQNMVQHFKSLPAEAAPNLHTFGTFYEAPNYQLHLKKEKEKSSSEKTEDANKKKIDEENFSRTLPF